MTESQASAIVRGRLLAPWSVECGEVELIEVVAEVSAPLRLLSVSGAKKMMNSSDAAMRPTLADEHLPLGS